MMQPLTASVIIANFNHGDFLANAIESGLGQTYSRTEVIVVDDGSTDDSRSVIAGFGSRVSALFKQNGGQGSAWNAGFSLSRGAVIVFLDADDTLDSSALGLAVEVLRDRRNAKAQWQLRKMRNGVLTGHLMPGTSLAQGEVLPVVLRRGPFSYHTSPASGNAWPRWWLEKVLPMPELPFRVAADSYLFNLAPVFGEIGLLTEPLGTYGLSPNGITAMTTFLQARGCWEASAFALKKHLNRELSLNPDIEVWKQRSAFYQRTFSLAQLQDELASALPIEAPVAILYGGSWQSPLLTLLQPSEILSIDDFDSDWDAVRRWVAELPSRGFGFVGVAGATFNVPPEYESLKRELTHKCKLVTSDDRLTVFDLTTLHGR